MGISRNLQNFAMGNYKFNCGGWGLMEKYWADDGDSLIFPISLKLEVIEVVARKLLECCNIIGVIVISNVPIKCARNGGDVMYICICIDVE
jgi:hypothetical protein